MALIDFTDKGLYCAAGNFYIDPWVPVDYAVITHAHSDHAHAGSSKYLCHHLTKPILRFRLGEHVYESVEWNEPVYLNGVRLSLHPAGHIIGSSQVRVEHRGEVWVISGDYKTENDGISGRFEPVRCHTFVTESTFGLPIYNWKPQQSIYDEISNWLEDNQASGKTSVIIAYSLGKAQRVLHALQHVTNRIYAHGAVYNMHQALQREGVVPPGLLPAIELVTPDTPRENFRNALVIAPPSAERSAWMKRFPAYRLGICSGWMQVRGHQRRKNADGAFVLSDHCDWKALLGAIEATGAEKVYVTHGFQSALCRYLNESGIPAGEVKTSYGNEDEETNIQLTDNTAKQVANEE